MSTAVFRRMISRYSVFSEVQVLLPGELVDLPLGHAFGDARDHLDDIGHSGIRGDGQGPGQQEIPDQDGHLVAPHRMGGLPPPPEDGAVHQVVVEEGGRVEVFEHRREKDLPPAAVPAQPCGQHHEQGPESFAAAEQEMAGHVRNDGEMGPQIFPEGGLDGDQVRLDPGQDAVLQIGAHGASPTRSYSRVSVMVTGANRPMGRSGARI